MDRNISVVIPLSYELQTPLLLLEDLSKQTLVCDIELILVSAVEQPAVRESLTKYFPEGTFALVPNGNLNQLRNESLRLAKGALIVLLDPGIRIFEPHFINRHVEAHRHAPDAIAVTAPVVLSPAASGIEQRFYSWLNSRWSCDLQSPDHFYLINPKNVSLKAEKLTPQIYFDESLTFEGSERELSLRLLAQGHTVGFFPNLAIPLGYGLGLTAILYWVFQLGLLDKCLSTRGQFPRWRYYQNPALPPAGANRAWYALFDWTRIVGQKAYPLKGAWGTAFVRITWSLLKAQIWRVWMTRIVRGLYYSLEFIVVTSSFRHRQPTRLQENNSALRKLGSRRSNYDIIEVRRT